MNVSRIRQMALQGDMSKAALRYLIDCRGECEHLDFKEDLDLASDHGCASFSKDVVGMKNVGGGYIVVGVQDKTWKPVGISNPINFDTKMLREKVIKATGLAIDVDIVPRELFVEGDEKKFALILVRASAKASKRKSPSICKQDFHSGERWGVRGGDIYVRDSDQTKRLTTDEEFRKLLENLEDRHHESEIEQADAIPSPFAVESGLYRILPREYETFIGRDGYKDRLRGAIEQDPRIWIVNLHGPGGVGKSALATWLAYTYYQEQSFEAILHLSAKDQELSTESGIQHLRPTLVSLEDFLDRILHLFEHAEYCEADLPKQKTVVTEILSAYRTLLILDNMETVRDGRIMDFVRALPPGTQSKALLTSRRRTSDWEFPIQVSELNEKEVEAFIEIRNRELRLGLPLQNPIVVQRIALASGGLPLAIQWTLGEYARTHDLDRILSRALESDSPLLEFSFRNSWNVLDEPAQQALAVLSIFDGPPTLQLWRLAMDWPVDKMEKAIGVLVEVTFVTERTDAKTGSVIYHALPITINFARNQLNKFVNLERDARARYQEYQNRLQLHSVEADQFSDLFMRFDATTETQKQAIMLSRMAEGQATTLGYESANQYYQQALEVDPRSVYALVQYGLFKLDLGNIGEAEKLILEATQRCTKKTGYYVYFNLARVHDKVHNRIKRAACLRKALEFEPNHTIARHSLGVALSQMGEFDEALGIFDKIISEELSRQGGPRDSLVYALKTKIITLNRAGRSEEAARLLQDAKKIVNQHGAIRYRAYQLEELEDDGNTMSVK